MGMIELKNDEIYDLLILGGGPAALNAALYAKRKGMNIGIICKDFGGHAKDTVNIENYLGFMKIDGFELIQKFQEQILQFELPVAQYVEVIGIEDANKDVKKVLTSDKNTYMAKTLLFATGSKHRHLGVEGEKELFGMGLSYCAICDGPLFRDRDVIIAGGGNSAVSAAIDLSKICKNITIVHRSQLRADEILQERLKQCDNVDVYLEHQIQKVLGDEVVEGVKALDKKNNKIVDFKSEALFIEIGLIPNSEYAKGIVDTNVSGEFIIDNKAQTSVPGIFAAGDVTTSPYKQIVIAAGEGAIAALAANEYLNRK